MTIPVLRQTVAVVALCCAAVSACSPADRRAAEPEAESAAAKAAPIDDGELETYVRARFQTDPGIRARNIRVSVDDGVVTLGGMVPTDQARAHLVSTAREVGGVRSVNDELRVGEGVTSDSREAGSSAVGTSGSAAPGRQEVHTAAPLDLATRVRAEFFKDDDVRGSNVEVSASDAGVVTLRGEAESALASQEAERIARETSGVSSVENRIRLAGEPERAADRGNEPGRPLDPWITAKIRAKYFMDETVKAGDIDVDTDGGVVTLSGRVPSEAEKRLAVALARNTDGVHSVNDQLRIEADSARGTDADGNGPVREAPVERRTRQAAGGIDDAWLTTKIQSRYFLEPGVKAGDIDVNTAQGIVTLTGTVESTAERRLAETIARETDGVTRVVNRLQVAAAR